MTTGPHWLNTLAEIALLLHVGVTFAMTGIIWFVQIAYYPNLRFIGRRAFVRYQREHIRRVTFVAWTMLSAELVTAIVLVVLPTSPTVRSLLFANLALLLYLWYSTFFIQVPLHRILEQGFDLAAYRRLVASNWTRVVVWTVRAIIVLAVLWTKVVGV